MPKTSVGLAVSLVAVVVTAGCSPNPNVGEAKRQYLLPTLCEKQLECVGQAVFTAAYPDGIEGCKKKGDAAIPASQNDAQSACSDDEWQACSRDMKAATCPVDPAKGGIPELPASCSKC
jgi:hypothetical protein